MKIFNHHKIFDLKFNEETIVEELINDVSDTLMLDKSDVFLFSKNKKAALELKKSFRQLGVVGGDTLILVQRDIGNNEERIEAINDYKNGLYESE